jgi:hypothetical protein
MIKVLHISPNYSNQTHYLNEAINKYSSKKIKSSILKIDFTNQDDLLRLITSKNFLDYDIYHYWNRSIFTSLFSKTQHLGLDLLVLKAYKKKIVFRYTGFDIRLKKFEKQINKFSVFNYFNHNISEENRFLHSEMYSYFADAEITTDYEMQFYKPNSIIIPRIFPLKIKNRLNKKKNLKKIIIAHTSTDEALKGTNQIIKIVNNLKLKKNDIEIELDIIKNCSPSESLKRIKRADLFIDQMLLGWYGVAAVEAMAHGVPTICYINPLFKDKIKQMPIINANLLDLPIIIDNLINEYKKNYLSQNSKDSFNFVKNYHNPKLAALTLMKLYIDLYENDKKFVKHLDLNRNSSFLRFQFYLNNMANKNFNYNSKYLFSDKTKKKAIILSRKNLNHISRVTRLADSLSKLNYETHVYSFANPVKELRLYNNKIKYHEVTRAKDLKYMPFKFMFYPIMYFAKLEKDYNIKKNTSPFYLLKLFRLFYFIPLHLLFSEKKFNFNDVKKYFLMDKIDYLTLCKKYLGNLMTGDYFGANVKKFIGEQKIDLILFHDNYSLYSYHHLKKNFNKNCITIYDIVENTYSRIGVKNSSLFSKIIYFVERFLEKKIINKVKILTTVGETLGFWYKKRFKRKLITIHNSRIVSTVKIKNLNIKQDLKIKKNELIYVWTGSPYPAQGVENIIKAFKKAKLKISHLAIIGSPLPMWNNYYDSLKKIHLKDKKIHFVNSIDPLALINYLSGANFGIIFRELNHLNNKLSLPNKFFEYGAAKLPILSNNILNIKYIVNKFKTGKIFNDEKELVKIFKFFEKDKSKINYYKKNVEDNHQFFLWEKDSKIFRETIEKYKS